MARKKPAPKRGASRYQAPAKKPVPGWVWLACGLIIGGFVMFLLNLEPGRDEVRRPQEEPRKPVVSSQPEANKPKYDFYTLLPESEVIVPPEAAGQPTPPPVEQKPVTPEEAARIDTARAQAALNGEVPPPAPPVAAAPPAQEQSKPPVSTQYFLQAGSFRKREDADRVRAQIILLGQDVRVESGTVRDETWYRVLVGPYPSRDQLSGAQKQLASAGYANLLLQQRQVR